MRVVMRVVKWVMLRVDDGDDGDDNDEGRRTFPFASYNFSKLNQNIRS